jgi:molybdenum-dependent DNA-binding transcriptional regulator ModE
MNPQRVTADQVITAYRETGSVWKAAKALGLCGQSVWERLRGLGHPLAGRKWGTEELAELRSLAQTSTIGEIAKALGRPYYGVAIKLSRLGLARRVGNRRRFIQKPRGGLAKGTALAFAKLLPAHRGSLRQFAKQNGVALGTLTYGLQQHAPEAWAELVRARGLSEKTCVACEKTFLPMTAKQIACGPRCVASHRRDREYFGGKRVTTIGLAEKLCQVCGRTVDKGLSSHHVHGKENDPDNDVLVALCRGCHRVVGHLGKMRAFADNSAAWESLVSLALMLKHGESKPLGVHVSVEWEWLTADDLADEDGKS